MTTNQTPLAPLNAPPTIRDLNQNHAITIQAGSNNFGNANGSLTLSQNYAIRLELKNISREVTKIAEKQKYQNQRPQLNISTPLFNSTFSIKQLDKDFKNILNLNSSGSPISKYNYYGHQYRYETQKPQKNPQKLTQSKGSSKHQELQSLKPTQKNQAKRQELNAVDSQSYYIYFDDPKNKSDLKESYEGLNQTNQCYQKKSDHTKNRIYFSQQLNEPQKYPQKKNSISYVEDNDQARTPPVHVFSKRQPSSKWVLQKKVKKLQKQLNSLKKKQDQRQKLKNFSYNYNKKDQKVCVGRQVDQLINSLWP